MIWTKIAQNVTNDIKNVLADNPPKSLGFNAKKIIYRDSNKVFDGDTVNEHDKFSYFYPIRESSLNRALAKVEVEGSIIQPKIQQPLENKAFIATLD